MGVTADELLAGEDLKPASPPILPEKGEPFSKSLARFQICALLSLLPAILCLVSARIFTGFWPGHTLSAWNLTAAGSSVSLLLWLAGWFRFKARTGGKKIFPVTGPWLAAGLWFWCLPSIPLLQYLLYLIKVFATGQISDSGVGFWEGGGYMKIWGSTLITYAVLMILATVIICLWANHMKKESAHD